MPAPVAPASRSAPASRPAPASRRLGERRQRLTRGRRLPSLAELSQQPILDIARRPAAVPPPRGVRHAVASIAETRKAAMSTMEAAMPSLDEESARLVARAHALLDSRGRLIGMNTAIYSPSGTSAGIGFAVPVDTLKQQAAAAPPRGPPPFLDAVVSATAAGAGRP